jgi:hypothetical protein
MHNIIADTPDIAARVLAIYAAIVATAGLGWQVFAHTRSGWSIRPKKPRLRPGRPVTFNSDVEITVVNKGRMAGRVVGVGLCQLNQRSMSLPIKFDPQDLPGGHKVVVTTSMASIISRWYADGDLALEGWAELADGGRRYSWGTLHLKTPSAPTGI